MKKVAVFSLTTLFVIASFGLIQAMEMYVGEYPFLRTFIFDIQNEARDLTQKTGIQYRIVNQEALLERCLKILGLGLNSIPLDIKYHYELMQQKLVGHDGLHNTITKAYNQLIHMLSEMNEKEMKYLVGMSFKELQAMELEGKEQFMHQYFLEGKDKLIDTTIEQLKKDQQQYIASHQVAGLPKILQTTFKLPINASPHVVDECYKKYMEEYQEFSNNLIAHATMGNISTQKLKNRLKDVAKVIDAYNLYKEKRGH